MSAVSNFNMPRLSYFLYISLLIFCPLAFGTVETWSLTVLETCTAISFLLLAISFILNRRPSLKIPGIIPLFLLLVFMFLQLIPLPSSIVHFLSPATHELYKPILELYPAQTSIPLTVHRKSTLLTLFTFSSYAFIYLLTVYHCSRAEQLKKTLTIVTTLGIVIAIEAIIQKLSSPDLIYWFRPTPNSTPVGPWVYSNHFAGFMEMLFPLTVALFLFHRPQVSYNKTFREKFVSLMTMPGANRYLLLGTGAILMAVSILLSISRGGIITLSIAFLFFVLFTARITADTRTRWAIILTSMVLVLIYWLGWDPILDKFGNLLGEKGINTSGRLPVLLDSINIFRDYPVFGSGFGTFIHVYPGVRTVPGEAIFDHAHNDYIELLSTGGVVGFFLCGWFVLAILTHSIIRLYKRRDRYSILLTSGALTGILALLFHCQADFQMYNGANGLYFFFLCGLAVSTVNTRIQYRTRPTLLRENHYIQISFHAVMAIILLIACSYFKLNAYRAEKLSEPFHSTTSSQNISTELVTEMHTTITQSSSYDPLESRYPFLLGQASTLLGQKKAAEQEYLQASFIQPTSGLYLQHLALSLDEKQSKARKDLFQISLERTPLNLEQYLIYSQWLLKNDQPEEAFSILNKAMTRIPWKTRDIINYILPLRFTFTEVEEMLLNLPEPWYEAGRIIEKSGKPDKAILFYSKAIEMAGKEQAKPHFFAQLYRIFLTQGDEQKALEILRKGIEYLPDNARFREQLGDYYSKQGIYYRAEQEYTQALRLNPDNVHVRRKVEAIKQKIL